MTSLMRLVAPSVLVALSLLVGACAGSAPPSPSDPDLPSPPPSLSSPPATAPPSPSPSPDVSGAPPADPAEVAGRKFLSVRVTQGAEEIQLVEDTRIIVTFVDRRVLVYAGCNHLSGRYRLEGDTLATGRLSSTALGCDHPRHAQDDWVAGFFSAGPTIQLAGNDLVLAVDDRSISLLDRVIADPDLPLAGTRWTVDSLLTAVSASSVPLGATSTFRFTENGLVEIDTGCNTGGGRYAVDADAGTIRFSDLVFTRKACTAAPGELEGAVTQVLAHEELTFDIEARVLELMADPIGLGLRGS